MVREIQDVHSEPDKHGRGTRETHPAFGTAIVARSHGTSHPLFQSDVQHSESITLSIRRAERARDLNSDWVHPTDELVEIEMSLSQWGALVSSIGIGSGVPVTIRSTESDRMVADLPYQPRIAENVDETKAAVAKLLADAKRTLAALEEAVDGKQGVKATRDALRRHAATLNNAESNAAFAVRSLADAAEKVTSQAKSDIEAHILAAAQLTGLASPVDLPALGMERGQAKEIES